MKIFFLSLCFLGICFLSVTTAGNPRALHQEIGTGDRKKSFGEQVGTPLVLHKEAEPGMRARVSTTDEFDDDDDEEEDNDLGDDVMNHSGKSEEEKGNGYDNIKGMDPDDDEEEETSGGVPDLNGDLPPDASQLARLPKDIELTSDEVDRKMADQRKGYLQFTIKQRFKPDLKYKDTSAYKILAGNVEQDVEKALKIKGVVKDVLFREAKNIGGPPYRSKVEVYLKVNKDVTKRMKKIVNYGLINGMLTIPGSFHA